VAGDARDDVENDEQTDEWFLSWLHLAPCCAAHIAKDSACVDLGCGTSGLAFDLANHLTTGTVLAIDGANGAIKHMQAEKIRRQKSGSQSIRQSANRATFVCEDVTLLTGSFSVSMDKGTTDAMLCDADNGAARCKAMYAAVASTFGLHASAVAVVISWRDPTNDGLDWLVDLVVGGLKEGSASESVAAYTEASTGLHVVAVVCAWSWQLDIHSAESRMDGQTSPSVYVVRRTARRVSQRPTAARAAAAVAWQQVETANLTVRQHLYEG
jgi:alkylhydroperoxidase family enzyme